MSKKDILLSVIIPCKNEEKNIEKCLDSVLAEMKDMSNTEVLVVDSGSTDTSIEISKGFPVDIIQLRSQWFSSPASARYLGCLKTTGKYIFVIDADMQLMPGFLGKALEFLEQKPEAAGAAGMGTEHYDDGSVLEDLYERGNRLAKVGLLGGAAIFRREAFLKSGGYFNPFLKGEEEQEVCIRFIKAGFELFSLPYPMIKHYTYLHEDNFQRRLQAGMYKGIGQMFRLTITQGNFSLACFMRFKLFYGFIALIGLFFYGVFEFAHRSNVSLLVLWAGIIVLIWLVSCYIKKGIRKGTYSMYRWVSINMQILRGMFDYTYDMSKYPQDVIIIKKSEYKL